MSDPVFPTSGDGINPMLARVGLMDKVWGALSKATPSNLSVIGPRWIGKTVLLKAIADRAVSPTDSPYSLVVHWHLGHVCPTTDAEFISGLCRQIHNVMQRHHNNYSDYQKYLKDASFSHLKEITDLLDEGDEPLLMLWDGLDKPLGQENLSVHLWDQMRSIIDGKKHKIVTATRAPLDLLIRNEQASTSEFWNIFDEVYVKPFDDTDRDALLEIASLIVTGGGKTEVSNWTGGHPRLVFELLNRLAAGEYVPPINNESVVEAAGGMVQEVRRSLHSIWHECPVDVQEAYRALVQKGEETTQAIGTNATDALKARGFVNVHRNKAKPSCHLMREYLSRTSGDSGSLARLFKAPDDFRSNIGDVLRIRLAQIPVVNNDLHRWVTNAIEGIPDNPGDCLINLTDVEDKALDLILTHELGEDRVVSEELLEYWQDANHHQNKVVSQLLGQKQRGEPLALARDDRAMQCGLLELLTGNKERIQRKTKSVSMDTYALINAIHCLRNRKNHGYIEAVSLDVAISTMMLCISLLDRLACELS